MDEPTAPLTVNEVQTLFRIIHELKAKGVTIIYISHRLEELFEVADRVTVMRDGCYVATKPIGELDRNQLIKMMAGHDGNAKFKEIPDALSATGGTKTIAFYGDTFVSAMNQSIQKIA